jgi:SRSO17 transposase
MSTILEHPEAQDLLDQTDVAPQTVNSCSRRLTAFIQRYLPFFYRQEHRLRADTILRGKLTGLQRKTTEPIATQAHQKRRPLQHFVGAGLWSDASVTDELRRHVHTEIAHPEAVLVLDPSAVAKKGNDSCGVQRQWCGRLGKIDNCQIGVFLGYVSRRGQALVGRQLYLPQEWAEDPGRRKKAHVPESVRFQESWRIGLDLIDRAGPDLPFAWVAGDDEFGRCAAFRAELRRRRLRYVLDVPCNTQIRDLGEAPAEGRRRPPWRRVDAWAQAQPRSRWHKVHLGAGSKGPRVAWALEAWVQTRDEGGRVGRRERLLVIRTVDREPRCWYALSNGGAEVPLATVVEVHGRRHGAEELFGAGKGEVGLGHYEVRSWVGWHHHMTLSLLALWFLILERRRLGGENPGGDGVAGAGGLHPAAACAGPEPGMDRGGRDAGVVAEGGGADLQVAQGDRRVPTPPLSTGHELNSCTYA